MLFVHARLHEIAYFAGVFRLFLFEIVRKLNISFLVLVQFINDKKLTCLDCKDVTEMKIP